MAEWLLGEWPKVVRSKSFAVALPEGRLVASSVAAGDPREVAAATARQLVPDGPFAVLAGNAIVEFENDDSLLFVRPGMLCEFAQKARARWIVTAPLRLQPLSGDIDR